MASESNYRQIALLTCLSLDILGAAIEQKDSLEEAQQLVRKAVAQKNKFLIDPETREKFFKEAAEVFTLVFDSEAREALDRATHSPRPDILGLGGST